MKTYLLLITILYAIGDVSGQGLSFAGERLPLDNQAALNYFFNVSSLRLFSPSQLDNVNTRAKQYFPLIEEVLNKYQIPEDFKYLAVVESSLLNVQSNKKAKGIWQIMPGTAKDLGLNITTRTDEREQVVRSTIAACKLLVGLSKKFSSWTLAAAAYNAGMGKVDKAITQQGTRDFYQLKLNKETTEYIYKIMVYKLLLQAKVINNPIVDNVFNSPFSNWSVFPENDVELRDRE